MDTKSCGHCVPAEAYNKLARQWNIACLICLALMLLTAVVGVRALEWRQELAETRWALDNATQRLVDHDLAAPAKPVKAARKRQ